MSRRCVDLVMAEGTVADLAPAMSGWRLSLVWLDNSLCPTGASCLVAGDLEARFFLDSPDGAHRERIKAQYDPARNRIATTIYLGPHMVQVGVEPLGAAPVRGPPWPIRVLFCVTPNVASG